MGTWLSLCCVGFLDRKRLLSVTRNKHGFGLGTRVSDESLLICVRPQALPIALWKKKKLIKDIRKWTCPLRILLPLGQSYLGNLTFSSVAQESPVASSRGATLVAQFFVCTGPSCTPRRERTEDALLHSPRWNTEQRPRFKLFIKKWKQPPPHF